MDILSFSFNPFALQSFFSLLVNLTLILIVSRLPVKTPAHKWLLTFLLCIAFWAAGESLSRSSVNSIGGAFWDRLSSLGWIFAFPVGLSFGLAYMDREQTLTRYRNLILLFGPAFIFLGLTWTTNLVFNWNPSQIHKFYYGWYATPQSLFSYLIFPWFAVLQLILIAKMMLFNKTLQDPKRRWQSNILILSLLIPMVIGDITNGVFIVLNIGSFVELGVVSTSIMCAVMTYAILKYKLFYVSPAIVASNIVNTINEIVIVFDRDGKVEFVNDAVERVLDYQKEQLIGLDFRKILVSKESGAFAVTSFGKLVPVNLSFSEYKDAHGAVIDYIVVATDISQLKELLDVETEKNKLNAMMESISDGVLALDPSGKIILVNEAATRIINMPYKNIIGQPLDSLLSFSYQEQTLSAKNLLPKSSNIQGVEIIQRGNAKMTTKQGKSLYIALVSSAIELGKERGVGAIVTLHDMTKERELGELKLDFVSMAVHELRTPLTAIKSYLSVFMKENMDKMNSEQQMFLNRIDIATGQIIALIENLLSISRIERGIFTVKTEAADWIEILKQSISDFSIPAKDKNLKLEFAFPQERIPKVQVDKLRIAEVLTNLLSNAVTYTNKGGHIKIWLEIKPDFVITHITDTGQGIPKEFLPHLFTKFFRVTGKLEGSKGNGLGLYISQAIVEMHHGKIWAESEVGKGSTFSFSLPVAGTYSIASSLLEPSYFTAHT